MSYQSAYSVNEDIRLAVKEIKEALSDITDPSLVVYFVSPVFPVDDVGLLMASAFPSAQTVGCTTAGEMVSGKMLTNSVVAMACARESIPRLKAEVLECIREDKQAVSKALKNIGEYFEMPASQLSPSRYAGMLLIDGNSLCEEYINDQIGNLTNVVFVGGSAASDAGHHPVIFVNGKTYTGAAVMVMMEPVDGFAFLKTQSMALTDKKLMPTKVDESRRLVYEFNHKPAVEAYAETLGVTVENLHKYLTTNPLGLVYDTDNYFVRDACRIEDGGAIAFFCSVKEGLELTVLQSEDIVTDTRKDLEQAWFNHRQISAVIEFNCVSRFAELHETHREDEYAALFRSIPAIAFATFGESYIGHMNQTSTMLLLK